MACAGARPLKDVPLWFLKLVPPPAVTTVVRPLTPRELLLEGTGGGILASPKGEDAGRLLSFLSLGAEEEEDEDGGAEEAEEKAASVLVEVVFAEEDAVLE